MNRPFLLAALFLCCFTAASLAQTNYEVSFDNRVHHEAVIIATFSGITTPVLEVVMSRSSPGRYAVHEFAKNMYTVRAVNGRGQPLAIVRPSPNQWNIAGHDGTVKFTYTLFADYADGTYAGIDATHAHFNMPAAFVWARGFETNPISITFKPVEKWKVATQLAPTKSAMTFTAPDLQYFMDSPTELSDFAMSEWVLQSNGKNYQMRIALHHTGTAAELAAYTDMAKAIVQEATGIYGELPEFDYGTYTFIADYLPDVRGDGMEHRNSTLILSTADLKKRHVGLAGTLSHEFFHAWNVERIRPRSLEPFDFERANMSGELWFAEGFTNYFGELMMHRAGVTSIDAYAKKLSAPLGQVITSPARNFFSPVEMSMQAPFVDAATAIDRTNRANTYLSYYTYGEAIGVGLDLTLRAKFNLTLDDFMKLVWRTHGKTERPYTNEDLRTLLGTFTKDTAFADDFFKRYIYGREVVGYESLLKEAGFLLRPEKNNAPSLGQTGLKFENDVAVLSTPAGLGSPLYLAGLDQDDKIFSLDGSPLTAQSDIDTVLSQHKANDVIEIQFEQRGKRQTAKLTLAKNERLEVVLFEQAQLPVSESIRAFREKWLASKATVKPQLVRYCPKCMRAFPFGYEFCNFDGKPLQLVKEKVSAEIK
ncbi:MAG: M61 family metallopeptidase [Rhizobacter sp.]|nr:M61 family metallopeptidase [Chlorobiales bacterium]